MCAYTPERATDMGGAIHGYPEVWELDPRESVRTWIEQIGKSSSVRMNI